MSENAKKLVNGGDNNVDEQQHQHAPHDHRFLLLMNINETCNEEMIQLYVTLMTSTELQEDLKIEELKRHGSNALIRFNKDLDYKIIELKHKILPSLGGQTTKFKKIRVPNAIVIKQIPVNCTQEILKLYFSNEKISHGGDIEQVRLFQTEGKALIQFKDYRVVDRVIGQTHVICDTQVKVDQFYPDIEKDGFVDEALVQANFNKNTNNKDLKTKKLLNQIKTSTPFITKFLESENESVDRTKLVLGNIPENISTQQLDFYISLLTNRSEIHQVFWSYEFKGKLLIEFKQELDLKHVFTEFNRNQLNNLNGRPLQLETVNLSRTLILLLNELPNKDLSFSASNLEISRINLNESEIAKIPATRDLLILYFVNTQRSGGGEIEFIERKSSKYWIVKMKDIRVVKEIMSRKHFVDYKQIKTFPYYENFGLPFILDRDEHLDDNLNALYKFKLNDVRFRYFLRVKHLHDRLNDIISETNALSKYNKTEPHTLYVIYHQRLICKIPILEKYWRLKVKEAIEYFMQVYKYEKLTLSYNQWSTILKTKQIDESVLFNDDNDDDFEQSKGPTNSIIVSYRDTQSNIEMNIVGQANEVERFIVKMKDIICKAYFTYELEERIINFKTYLLECEQLLEKWLKDKDFDNFDDDNGDIELMLQSSSASRSNIDTQSLSGMSYSSRSARTSSKLDKNKRKTIDDFITKLEKDYLDMDLSYGKLFQELGYTFLSRNVTKSNLNETFRSDANDENEDEDDYRDYDENIKNEMDENYLDNETSNQSQMDKMKISLDELKTRIANMRLNFRNYLIDLRKTKGNRSKLRSITQSTIKDDDTLVEDAIIKICVYVKEQMKIITLSIERIMQVKELKETILKQIRDENFKTLDDLKLTFNGVLMANDFYSVDDYSITDKCTITCELASY